LKYLSYILFRCLVAFFALLPFPIIYFISDCLHFVFKHIFKYRIAVIDKNLAYSFPEWSPTKRLETRNTFYKNFIDLILESLKGMSIDPYKLIPRYRFKNPELMDSYYDKGEHIIIYSQHYNNWEWAPICLGLQMKHHLVGVIKEISNKHINQFFLNSRAGNNVSVIPTYKTASYFIKVKELDQTVGIVFIADQKPSGTEKSIPLEFLAQQASFHAGAAKYAIKSGLAVFSLDVHRIGRGRFEVEAVKLADAGEYSDPVDLTEVYKKNLEQLIYKSPASWLWSHKRYKDFISY